MTDLRLRTEMFDEMKFCPFCGFVLEKVPSRPEVFKRCSKNRFHILVIHGEETVIE
jgi:hypothetical protein